MKRGYTRSWRKEIESDIWKMPPMYHRVFYWLRQKASWRTMLIPTRNGIGIWLTPGMIITSYSVIANAVGHEEWGIEKTPDRKSIMKILYWLEQNNMIRLYPTTLGSAIYIVNWDVYQSGDEDIRFYDKSYSLIDKPKKSQKFTKNLQEDKKKIRKRRQKNDYDKSNSYDPYSDLYIRFDNAVV
ncbi:primosome component [Candidatus Magnetoovum chiemensis]|nr:primosome component [Candidatus Magnetoovum chiemensis]